MHRKLWALTASLTLGMAGAVALAGAAQATEDPPLSASHETACHEDGGAVVTLTFVNTTGHTYSADVQRDREAGTPDEVTGQNIANGPHAGKPFGKRFNPVELPPGETITHTVTFDEDSGEHRVRYRIWRGPENDYYVDWKGTGAVDTDCLPASKPSDDPSSDPSDDPSDDPSTDPSDDPSADPSTDPSTDPSADPSVTPTDDVATDPAGGGDLPRTGYPRWMAWVVGGGLGLVASGAGLLLIARRRGWIYS